MYNEKDRTNGGGYKRRDEILQKKLWNRMLETSTWCLGQMTNFLSIKKIDRSLLALLLSMGTAQPLNIRTGKQKKKNWKLLPQLSNPLFVSPTSSVLQNAFLDHHATFESSHAIQNVPILYRKLARIATLIEIRSFTNFVFVSLKTYFADTYRKIGALVFVKIILDNYARCLIISAMKIRNIRVMCT